MGQGKIRVQFDRSLEKGQGAVSAFAYRVFCPKLKAFSASSDGVVASSNGVAYLFLHRTERLAELAPHMGGRDI